MSDRTPPADLIDKLAAAMWHNEPPFEEMAWDEADDGDRYHYRTQASRSLAALVEWADGALVDPTTWQRLDATEVGDGWVRNAFTGELSPWDLDDGPAPPENRIYTITTKGN